MNELNPYATKIYTNSVVTVEGNLDLKGKKVIVVEDGPTLTHGSMSYGAGFVAATNSGAIRKIIELIRVKIYFYYRK